KLYVPVSSLHLVSRYTGVDPDQAPLHRLGSEQWQKARRKAAEQVRDVAAELLDLYARRAARKGHAFDYATDQYAAFAESFPFEETPDQEQAIESVLADLRSPRPMDRLVCGDVGFGKTEVAMRAAFVAVQDGRQVAVLVPTTLLAQQHYDNFRDRFADWPVRIEVLSRFGGKRQQDEALKAVADGRADIVIGTHKLLQENVRFKRLGLVIIDEEHRFGVRQKERLKALRSEVDILTLTATPIPRTLNMAISGMRDLSIIATPPARRLSIKTFVRERSDAVIREAILREVLRGGQVYYLHNEVESIERLAREVEALVPEARVSIAHGQMRERELERVMSDFYHRRFNVLVCTTIIETGIDIPTANTIIMDRADKFGLAQMHQLRGRVGRSHHQAYAYLFTPPRRQLTPDAVKRLDAIGQLEDLGAGFALATHDLEIRGAGELLGEGQSGNMQAVGFGLYMEMLERAVKALKEGREPELDKPFGHDAEVDLHLPAFIPEDYLPDVPARLTLYKRIASAADDRALEELQVEMIDRFGLLPPQVKNLFRAARLKLKARPLGILKLEAGTEGGRIEFRSQPDIDPMRIIELLQSRPNTYRLDGQTKLRFNMPLETADRRFEAVEGLLLRLGPPERPSAVPRSG
ncbi:MAG: transcription-repair coupling factor, partial [Gammaproteobacteria bacterium]|nr:transcription-repair coupling factor [Gammaproteobacteria bacterium]